ncbi:uncharacterized protein LOC110599633 isoform X1 [Manihot esculenta]|uniref:Uncharacterized protein n=2 Tax=Manihot esculenta TaxID=3983 RepID=A0A2C9UHV8_MANES|nr:uncharacterized protein LOC110599633 isoform X1 [Manihot esculenta]KAG8638183.1 hypothetical protein MANES_14G007800v8 [Manihot esculenta]OAY30147.1 hypothetical protein MANES_14G007800v8 [Manihot esculenta]
MALSVSSKTKTYLTTAPAKAFTRFLSLRSQSNTPSHPYHTDLSDDSSTDPLLRKLEDAIHRILVRRAAPDWLPFLPGSSYWVPPPRSTAGSLGIAQLVEKLANPLTDEESLSMTTLRGWPSSDYFIKGALPYSMELNLTSNKEVEVEVEAASNNASKSEDEEG